MLIGCVGVIKNEDTDRLCHRGYYLTLVFGSRPLLASFFSES